MMTTTVKNFGISNTNSNCWLNSLMQALLSCPEFIKWIGRKSLVQHNNVVVREVSSMINRGGSLNSDVSGASGNLNGVYQFSREFMEAMSKFDPESSTKCADEAMLFLFNQFSVNLLAENQRLFGITIKSSRPCSGCGNIGESKSVLPFVQLYSNVVGDLGAWIMGAKESIIEGRICDKCKCANALPITDKVVGLRVLLPIITGGFRAEFEEFIKVDDFRYRLTASIEYMSGHYYAVCLRGEERMLFNDEYVRAVNCMTSSPYVVIYALV